MEVLLAVVASPLAVDDVEGDEEFATRLVKVLYVLSSFRKATRNDYLDAHYSLQHQTHTRTHIIQNAQYVSFCVFLLLLTLLAGWVWLFFASVWLG